MEHSSNIVEVVAGIITLLLIASVFLALCKKIKLPFTIVLVLAGTILAWVSSQYPNIFGALHNLKISPDVILFVFLPTLIFESAFNLDARQLQHNIGAVLTLAIPGLLLSTFIIGLIVHYTTSVSLPAALLLGAILSATDPVAVIALFKQLGAPHRLTLLVEGESLFNDASSIVVARILIGIVLAGTVSGSVVAKGAIDIVLVFAGGFIVGLALGFLTGYLLGKVESETSVEITLTTILAYLSFLVAEKVLHVSGVMATVGAGLTIGGWGRSKISGSVRTYIEHFWEYMAFVANALIFLMVGLRINLLSLGKSIGLLGVVIVAMLVSRAVVVYGLVPFVSRKQGGESVDIRYQTVIFWGGLRGGIAIALVLSLPSFEHTESFISVVTGAVLFTLIVQGLSIESLIKKFKLDKPPLADRFARLEGHLAAKQRALSMIPGLISGGLFSASIIEQLRKECDSDTKRIRSEIDNLRRTELNPETERSILFLLGLAEERTLLLEMFNKGHVSEKVFREHAMVLTLQADAIRYKGKIEKIRASTLIRHRIEQIIIRTMKGVPGLNKLSEKLNMEHIAFDYEKRWIRYQCSSRVLEKLDEIAKLNSIQPEVVEEIRRLYSNWHLEAQHKLDRIAEQFPEFVNAMHERLGRRLLLLAEGDEISIQANEGILSAEAAEGLQIEIFKKLGMLKDLGISELKIEPSELLRKVPFFREIPEKEFEAVAERMSPFTATENQAIITQGEEGKSLFMIARGVARVSIKNQEGETRDLATLVAGDFFGEMALLHNKPRTATVRAVTPCFLYELSRADLQAVMKNYPVIYETLREVDLRRRAEQA